MALVMTHEVPTSSTMVLPHGLAGVREARRRLRRELSQVGAPDSVVDDAVLILSELLSNACRYARPIDTGGAEPGVRAGWRLDADGQLVLEVTDGGGPTRPRPSRPSLSARGGRGLGIVRSLSRAWGVREAPGEVTVWALLAVRAGEGDKRCEQNAEAHARPGTAAVAVATAAAAAAAAAAAMTA